MITPPPEERETELSSIEPFLTQPRWRVSNLYEIMDKQGKVIPFRPNWAQNALMDELHKRNIILKARQLGFTTLIDIMFLDYALFRKNARCAIVADTQENAERIFQDRIKFVYEHTPAWLRALRPTIKDSARSLHFNNNSEIRVGLDLRGGTYQRLHISEFGKIAAVDRQKAEKIITGAINTVATGGMIFIESTAVGVDDEFHRLYMAAERNMTTGRELTPLDWKPHFFPWWKHPDYRLLDTDMVIPQGYKDYFHRLAKEHGIELDTQQKAWYVATAATQGQGMWKEYPSRAEEAFAASLEGAYFGAQLRTAYQENRIGEFPVNKDLPVHTAWDVGVNDMTAIWGFQVVGDRFHFVFFYQNHSEGFAHYRDILEADANARGYKFGIHYGPHDLQSRRMGIHEAESAWQLAREAGITFTVVPRTKSKVDAIEKARQVLNKCCFDVEACGDEDIETDTESQNLNGIAALRQYRKEWDAQRGTWKNLPRHDDASNAADAFMTFATGYRLPDERWNLPLPKRKRNI